jgi:8-oxo-dGTP pyrophosphatase MutT (NUDIX family)
MTDFPKAFHSFKKRVNKVYFNTSELDSKDYHYQRHCNEVYERKESSVYGGIIRSTDGKYLLVKGRRAMKWSFPKGHLKLNETPLDCAGREIFEETGCRKLPNPCGFVKIKMARYYLFDVPFTFDVAPMDFKEVCDIGWFTRDQAAALVLNVDAHQFFT